MFSLSLSIFTDLLTKSLRPLPEKHLGLSDVETKYRKRYLDLLTNSESQEVFEIRSKVVNEIRLFLIKDNFIEVETPIIIKNPCIEDNIDAIKCSNNYLRTSPELYHKRILSSGISKISNFVFLISLKIII